MDQITIISTGAYIVLLSILQIYSIIKGKKDDINRIEKKKQKLMNKIIKLENKTKEKETK